MPSLKSYTTPVLVAASAAAIIYSAGTLDRTMSREPYNPLAICSSGLGRSLSRWLTDEAEVAYHHGAEKKASESDDLAHDHDGDGKNDHAPEDHDLTHDHDGDGHNDHSPEDHQESESPVSSVGATPMSRSVDQLAAQLSFRAAVKSGRITLTQADIKGALQRTEFWYRLAFKFDPANYRAYDAYYFFLSTNVSNTDYARVLRPRFTAAELEERRQRAIEISREALASYRLDGDDAEQYLGAAMTWFNILDQATPDPKTLKTDATVREKYLRTAGPALTEMRSLILKASEVHKMTRHKLSRERQEDFKVSASGIGGLYRAGVTVYHRELDRSPALQ